MDTAEIVCIAATVAAGIILVIRSTFVALRVKLLDENNAIRDAIKASAKEKPLPEGFPLPQPWRLGQHAVECPSCQRPLRVKDQRFCGGCGTPLYCRDEPMKPMSYARLLQAEADAENEWFKGRGIK